MIKDMAPLGGNEERRKLVLALRISCGKEQPCPRLVSRRQAGVWSGPSSIRAPPPQATADPMQTPDAKDIQLLNNSCAHFLQKNDKIEQNEEPRVFQSSHQLEITQANT